MAQNGKKTPFADWLRKHTDREGVYFESLELVMSDDLEDLGRAEQRWITTLREDGHRLLNLTEGGLGPRGYVWTQPQRDAAASRARGRSTGVSRRGPDSPNWGRAIHSDEQKARWSEQRRGSITGASNPNFGKFGQEHPSFGHRLSEETKARLSEQKRGSNNPNFGKVMSDEERRVRSEKLKGRPRPSSIRSAHTRHHTNKGVFKESCRHCQADRLAAEGERE
ncbi:MAG: NUMOD3 domain-containing DNA-binding protein [Microbacterium sp.]|uniref:NUMOD3 domain-containing DNA-binding protein n=1 Tax=Microbacterium sp. TaxID=51671 RepID=UPI0039E4BF5E